MSSCTHTLHMPGDSSPSARIAYASLPTSHARRTKLGEVEEGKRECQLSCRPSTGIGKGAYCFSWGDSWVFQ